ncbi:MAG: polyprenyl synthetase family protein [Desulfobacterales bacterium]
MNGLKARILEAVETDLQAIEAALVANLTPHLELVREVAGHILFNGGKRMRPLLLVLSARLCGYRGTYDVVFSSALEYLHAATLLHDDLVDGAATRRRKPAAHRLWGNAIAVLVGDFLLARALSLTAATGDPKIVAVLARLTEEMSQGEVHQLQRKRDPALTEEEYFEVVRRKTAVLFEAACRVSALLAQAPAAAEEALSAYGLGLGYAFQIADDLLDYTADPARLGKDVGSDLREGKMTLPLIRGLALAGGEERARMIAMIREPGFTDTDFAWLRGRLEESGAIAYARRAAETRIAAAKRHLEVFPASPTRRTLEDLADYALERSL